MKHSLEKTLIKMGDQSTIRSINHVSGGQINDAFHVVTDQGHYFIKTNADAPANFFTFEANGLKAIAKTNTISVPDVYDLQEKAEDDASVLVLQWVNGEVTKHTAAKLGEQLAALHQNVERYYGLAEDGFIGTLKQPNQQTESWVEYFQKNKLQTQLNYGIKNNVISGNRRNNLENLIKNLANYIPDQPDRSLLHGDLWRGNWLAGENGQPYLVDPAILVGDRSFELAYTELFGGFPETFYDAYRDTWPLSAEYPDTKAIYQLFYLLVHLNIFGEHYGSAVDAILKSYV